MLRNCALETLYRATTRSERQPLRDEIAGLMRKARKHKTPQMKDQLDELSSLMRYTEITAADGRYRGASSSVEAETPLKWGVMGLLDVKGQKIGPLLDRLARQQIISDQKRLDARARLAKVKPGTSWFKLDAGAKKAKQLLGRAELQADWMRVLPKLEKAAKEAGVAMRELSWDQVGERLGASEQDVLLRTALSGVDLAEFQRNRELKPMHIPDSGRSVFLQRDVVVGGEVLKGRVTLTGFFNNKVEYRTERDMQVLNGIEAHRTRFRLRAGQNSSEVFDVLWALNSNMRSQHVHMPFRRRAPRTRRKRVEQAVIRTDHWRRGNLFGELLSALDSGTLERKADGNTEYFNFTNGRDMSTLYYHLIGRERLLPAELKIRAIGYRTGIYKNSDGSKSNLEGYEVRRISTGNRSETVAQRSVRETWLDSMQRSLNTGHWGINKSELDSWAKNKAGNNPEGAVVRLHYNSDMGSLLARVPRALLNEAKAVRARIGALAEKNYAAKMLIHDWSGDTSFLALPAAERDPARARVVNAQRRALKAMATPRADVPSIIKTFIRESGLLDVVGRSLGMDALAKSPIPYAEL
jgi:hypothetical protein